MAVEQRFATEYRETASNRPGLVLQDDGAVWLVKPDGSRELVGSGGGLPPPWTDGGHGNVIAMTDGTDVESIPLILRAALGQTDNTTSLLELHDEDGLRIGDWDAAGDLQLQLTPHNAVFDVSYGDGVSIPGRLRIDSNNTEPYFEVALPHTAGPGLFSNFTVGPSGALTLWVRTDDAGNPFLGFFGTAPVAQQPKPTTLGDVIAALTAYGLVAAA